MSFQTKEYSANERVQLIRENITINNTSIFYMCAVQESE